MFFDFRICFLGGACFHWKWPYFKTIWYIGCFVSISWNYFPAIWPPHMSYFPMVFSYLGYFTPNLHLIFLCRIFWRDSWTDPMFIVKVDNCFHQWNWRRFPMTTCQVYLPLNSFCSILINWCYFLAWCRWNVNSTTWSRLLCYFSSKNLNFLFYCDLLLFERHWLRLVDFEKPVYTQTWAK